MAIPQGKAGYVSFGGTVLPVYNWSMPNPRNLIAPDGVSNGWNVNYGEGLKTTAFRARCNLRQKATEYLATTFWGHYLTRTWSGGHDDTTGITIIASNSRKSFTLANCKAEAFVLTGASGMQVGLDIVFVAPGVPTPATVTPTSYSNFDNSPPLMWDNVSFSGITGNTYGWQINFANNHLPNGPHNGTKNLSSWDAGIPKCGAKFTFDTRAVGSEPFAAAANISVSLVGAATRVFSLTKVIPNNDLDGAADVGQVYMPWDCLVEGDTATPPLVVS